MDVTTLYLVRHGESTYNVQKRVQGQSVDESNALSVLGRRQVADRTESFKKIHFDACYSSTSIRCVQTADMLVATRGIKPIFLDTLQEKAQGDAEGKTHGELLQAYPTWKALSETERLNLKVFEGEESQIELRERCLKTLTTIAEMHLGQQILIVTHGGCMRATYTYLAQESLRDIWAFNNCGYLLLEYINGTLTAKHSEGLQEKLPDSLFPQ